MLCALSVLSVCWHFINMINLVNAELRGAFSLKLYSSIYVLFREFFFFFFLIFSPMFYLFFSWVHFRMWALGQITRTTLELIRRCRYRVAQLLLPYSLLSTVLPSMNSSYLLFKVQYIPNNKKLFISICVSTTVNIESSVIIKYEFDELTEKYDLYIWIIF